MFKVVSFEENHAKEILAAASNRNLDWWLANDCAHIKKITTLAECLTIKVDEAPLMCVFLVPLWTGRWYLSTIFRKEIGHRSIPVYRGLRRELISRNYRRIEMDVPCEMDIAHRRARFLGFNVMCKRARKYLPDGSDATIYEWIGE